MPATDEDTLRELMHHATDDLHAPRAMNAGIVTRHHRRRRNTRLLSITGAGVAAAAVVAAVAGFGAGVGVGTSVPSSAHHQTALPAIKLTPAQVLDRLSAAAAGAPQLTGRYVELTEAQGLGFGTPAVTVNRTSVIDSLTGNTWTYQQGPNVPSELPVAAHLLPTRAQFAAWPTNPAALRALLLSQGEHLVATGGQLPQETPDDLVFAQASGWLWDPMLSPALRSAMYKVLAATPGVTVKTGTTDMAGRPAIEISRPDSIVAEVTATFENPSTGAVLESYDSETGTDLYESITSSATLPANPYRRR